MIGPLLFVLLNVVAFLIRRSPYLMNAVMLKIGYVPQALIESKPEVFEKITPVDNNTTKSSLILINRNDNDEWQNFSDWLKEGSTLIYGILKISIINYYPQIVAAIAIILLIHIVRKKGGMPTIHYETKPIIAYISVII